MNACTRCLLLAALPALVGVCGEVVSVSGGGGPRFAAKQVTAVRGVEGRSATLDCRVLDLGDKAVSWIRTRDLQILSHGGAVFTADARVSSPHVSPPSHALRIDRLRRSDAGRYECQLNTEPKMSLFVHLVVVDESEIEMEASTAVAEVVEDAALQSGEVSVWAAAGAVRGPRGGRAELGCGARRRHPPPAAAPPLDIRWQRHGQPLTLQEGSAVWRSGGAMSAESRLRLTELSAHDAGEYSCAVGGQTAQVWLYVDDDVMSESEAMQRDQSASGAGAAKLTLSALLAAILSRFVVP